jgi:hypothetical protein
MVYAIVHGRLAGLAAALGADAAPGLAAEGAAAHIIRDAAVVLMGGALALEDFLGHAARGGAKGSQTSSFCARSWPGLRSCPCPCPCPCARSQSDYARRVRPGRGSQDIWYGYGVAAVIHTFYAVSAHPEHVRNTAAIVVPPSSPYTHLSLLSYTIPGQSLLFSSSIYNCLSETPKSASDGP